MKRPNLSLILIILALSAQLTFTQNKVNTEARNRIHYGDVIDVDVVGSFEFDWRGGITPEGFLDGFDKIQDQVFALCRTETELAAEIRDKYSRILREPTVVVRIIDRTKRPTALITGAVERPQRFLINRSTKLDEIISLSGGITDTSSGEVTIFRPPGASCSDSSLNTDNAGPDSGPSNNPQTFNIKISDMLAGDASANPLIIGGDVITVIKAMPVYVIGGVNNPSVITFKTGARLSRAIAMAGGLSKGADPNEITLFRKGTSGIEVKKINLSEIEAGRAEDIELNPYDVIEAGQKGRQSRSRPPVIETPDLNAENFTKLPLYIVD